MKYIKKILLIFLIVICLNITNANALAGKIENNDSFIFEYNNKVHVISERNIVCDGVNIDDSYIENYDLDGNFYFEDSESFEMYKITKENTCEIASEEDLFNLNNIDRYDLRLEKDSEGNIVINFYEGRYEEVYYQTKDTEKNNSKTYYVINEQNQEMIEFNENTFQNNQTYYEKGYASQPYVSEKDEDLTYYKRYGSVEPFILNISNEYKSEDVNNFYIINNDIDKPIKSIKVNKEAFQDFNDYDDINVVNLAGSYIIVLTTDDNSVYKDIEGNVLASGENLLTLPLGNDLYLVSSMQTNTSSIYYKNYNTKVIEVEKYTRFADTYYTEYYNLGIAEKIDNASNQRKNVAIEHKIYEIIEGQDQTYTNSNLKFRFSGELDLFHRLLINDVEIEETNYSKTSGSTIINLKSEYLNTLENGIHTLRVEYKDGGYVETTFTVMKNNSLSTFKVTLNANGGKFKNTNILTIDKWEKELENSLEEPTRNGYVFKGYYTEKTGGTKLEMILAESGIDKDYTFYAQWEKNVDVPKTGDNIVDVILMGTTSLIVLIGTLFYLKKSKLKN